MADIIDPEVGIKRCKYGDNNNDDDEKFDKNEDEKVDRLSELPVFIIHRILALLKSKKEVTKTSVLSKKWYNSIWSSYPELHFSEGGLFSYTRLELDPDLEAAILEELEELRNNFIKSVDMTLSRYQKNGFCIKSFYLSITVADSRVASFVDKWLEFLAQNKIEVLDLQMDDLLGGIPFPYSFPLSFFACTSLQILNLHKCRIESSVEDRIAFGSLKCLTLWGVDFQDDKAMNHIVSSCLLLEKIAVWCCSGLKELHIYGLHNLRSVVLELPSPELVLVDINALSLQHFSFNNLNRHDMPRIEMGACKNLMSLEMSYIVANPDWPFSDFVAQFPLMETLVFRNCTMEKFRISNSCLKKLYLYSCQKLTEVEINAPNLLSFNYAGDDRFPCISSTDTAGNWEAIFSFAGPAQSRTFLGLRHFLLKHEIFKIVKLRLFITQSGVNLNELTDISTGASFKLEHLKLYDPHISSDYAAVFDCILWSCSPRVVSLVLTHELLRTRYLTDFVKYLYEKLSHKHHTWCNGDHTGCWNHFVKDVEIEIIETRSMERTPATLSDLLNSLPTIGWSHEICFTLQW